MTANSFFNSKASEGPAERTERTLPGGEVTEPVLETAPVLPAAEPEDEVVEARLIPVEETEEGVGLTTVERVVAGLVVVDLRGVRVIVGVLVAVVGLVEVAVAVREVVVGVVLVAVAVVGVRRVVAVEGVVVEGVVVGVLRTVVVVGVAVLVVVVRLTVEGEVVVGVREDAVPAVLVGVVPVGLTVVLDAPAAPAALALLAARVAAVAARRAATEEVPEAAAPSLLLGLAGVLEVFAEVTLLLGLAGTMTPASSGAGVEGTASSSWWWSAVSVGWSTGAGDSAWVWEWTSARMGLAGSEVSCGLLGAGLAGAMIPGAWSTSAILYLLFFIVVRRWVDDRERKGGMRRERETDDKQTKGF